MLHVRSEIVTMDVEQRQETNEPRIGGILHKLDIHSPPTNFADRLDDFSLESNGQKNIQLPPTAIPGDIHESMSYIPGNLTWNAEVLAPDVSFYVSLRALYY